MYNRVTLVGRLGKDPERKKVTGEYTLAEFSLATDRRGDHDPDWHTIVVWGKQAEACLKYLEKGRQVMVVGRIAYNHYVKEDGSRATFTKIIAEDVKFLGGGNRGGDSSASTGKELDREMVAVALNDEEIPF